MTIRKDEEEKIMKFMYERLLELEKEHVYEPGSVSLEFESEIRELGFEFEISTQVERICQANPEITRDIVLKYYDMAVLSNEKAYLVNCLDSTYNKDLVPFFLKEFVKKENTKYDPVIVSIGNFLMLNADKKYTKEYIDILNMPKEDLPYGKGYIIWVFEKLKLQEAIEPMLSLLKEEENYTYIILNALRKYKEPSLLPVFNEYLDYKETDVRNVCKKAIAAIEKKMNDSKK